MTYGRDAQPAVRIRPWTQYIQPSEKFRNTRKFSWMTGILGMNLNLIELLAILQLITIRNGSDGKNIKLQAIKGLVKFLKIFFYTRLSKLQLIILSSVLEYAENSTVHPLAQRGCAPLTYCKQCADIGVVGLTTKELFCWIWLLNWVGRQVFSSIFYNFIMWIWKNFPEIVAIIFTFCRQVCISW